MPRRATTVCSNCCASSQNGSLRTSAFSRGDLDMTSSRKMTRLGALRGDGNTDKPVRALDKAASRRSRAATVSAEGGVAPLLPAPGDPAAAPDPAPDEPAPPAPGPG